MFFIWGTGGGRSDEGNIGIHQCEVCNNQAQFNAAVYYRYFHFWYIFSFLTSRQYIYECSHCSNGYSIKAAEFKKNFPKNHIPFFRKFSWLICLVIIAVLIGMASISSGQHQAEVESYIASPAVNDIYVADFAKIEDSGYNDKTKAYGAMKLNRVITEGTYYFAISTHGYEKEKGIRKELREHSIVYDDKDGMVFTKEQLKSLKDRKIITDVIRY